jgi:hypothetical protein
VITQALLLQAIVLTWGPSLALQLLPQLPQLLTSLVVVVPQGLVESQVAYPLAQV